MNPRPNLVLIGYRATGKTAVAGTLVPLLRNHPTLHTFIPPVWIDTDLEIERRTGRSIAQIFRESGEPYFRDCETRLLRELCTQKTGVIATGGGAPLRPENQTLLRLTGFIVWLTASPDTIARRIALDPHSRERRPDLDVEKNYHRENTTRDPLPIDRIRFVLRQREPVYRQLADLTLATDSRSVESLAQAILEAIPEGSPYTETGT